MNTNKLISELNAEQMDKDLPEFGPGDTVVVQVKVKEGTRERLQAFEGIVLAKRNRGLNSAFTVRKISHGIGVERTFQTYRKLIDSVSVRRRGDTFHSMASRAASAAASGRAPWWEQLIQARPSKSPNASLNGTGARVAATWTREVHNW